LKRLLKKNQIIITTLAIMIAIAGYLNYSGRMLQTDGDGANGEVAGRELLDIFDDVEDDVLDHEAVQGEVEGTPGEAVLTNAEASSIVAEAKVMREQVRARNRETLLGIIDNENLSDEQKQDAINQMIAMTEIAEREVTVETMLAAKGFAEVVVSLTADSADIVVNSADLTDVARAQITDIVTRKGGVAPENIVITPIHTGGR